MGLFEMTTGRRKCVVLDLPSFALKEINLLIFFHTKNIEEIW